MMERHPRGPEEMKAAAAELGVRSYDLLAMSPNNDPFNSGTPANWRDAQWFADLLDHFGLTGQFHNRRVHYLAQSAGVTDPSTGTPYTTDKHGRRTDTSAYNAWTRLTGAGAKARHLGLVDPLRFIDRRNAEPTISAPSRELPMEDVGWKHRHYPGWRLPDVDVADVEEVRLKIPTPLVSGYDYDPADQPRLLEVWCEKSTMADVLEPICRNRGVNLVQGAGFESITHIIDLLRRAERHHKPARVLYISDHDFAGTHMHMSVARTVQFYRDTYAPNVDFALKRIALTPDQISEYELPTAPDSAAVELDALEALHPGALRSIVLQEVDRHRDPGLQKRLRDASQTARQDVEERFWQGINGHDAELAAIQGEVNAIVERHRSHLEDLADEMQQELQPYRHRLDDLARQIAAIDITPDLPDRPAAEPVDGDTSDWLYRSDRHWRDQLDRFKSEKNGGRS